MTLISRKIESDYICKGIVAQIFLINTQKKIVATKNKVYHSIFSFLPSKYFLYPITGSSLLRKGKINLFIEEIYFISYHAFRVIDYLATCFAGTE